jgi:hypothetical protein
MKHLNRRKFIENSIKTAGVLSVAPIAGCQAPKGAEKINTDNIRKPLDMIERENLKIIGIKVTPCHTCRRMAAICGS